MHIWKLFVCHNDFVWGASIVKATGEFPLCYTIVAYHFWEKIKYFRVAYVCHLSVDPTILRSQLCLHWRRRLLVCGLWDRWIPSEFSADLPPALKVEEQHSRTAVGKAHRFLTFSYASLWAQPVILRVHSEILTEGYYTGTQTCENSCVFVC